MPTFLRDRLPKYRKHKASGQAIVTIAGKDHYLGPHGTEVSKMEYDRLVAQWLADGRPTRPNRASRLSVSQLLALFWQFAEQHYVKFGEPTGTADNYKIAIRLLRVEYGNLLVDKFGPIALTRLQQIMIERGYTRRYINDNTSRIKRIFKWGVSRELVDVAVHQGISTVEGIQHGRTAARESTKIRPVSDEIVDATLLNLPQLVADMVRIQKLTGARPCEVRLMKRAEIHHSMESLERVIDSDFHFTWTPGIWVYYPSSHKTQHHNRMRVILIGPKAQTVLTPYLAETEFGKFCFSPALSEEQRRTIASQQRVTPVEQGNTRGSKRKRSPKRCPQQHYSKDSYAKAINRACEKTFPIPKELSEVEIKRWKKKYFWAPNRIRHSAGTSIRKKFGLEQAQAVLGHARVNTTQIYAEKNFEGAAQVIKEVG